MYQFLTIHEIPSDFRSRYIERWNDRSGWRKLDKIYHDIACVITFNDEVGHYRRVMVAYKGMMQMPGGSGACDNPLKVGMRGTDGGKDKHMYDWQLLNINAILRIICHAKWDILEKMFPQESKEMYFIWNHPDFIRGMYGLLAGKLDLIGMGKMPIQSLGKPDYALDHRSRMKLLTC